MSDMAQGTPLPRNAMTENMTPMNPRDNAMMQKTGQLGGQDPPIGKVLETMGIQWDMPMSKVAPILSKNMQNAKDPGKLQNMAKSYEGGQGPQKPFNQGAKPMAQPSPQGSGGLSGLMGQMGG